MNPVQSTDRFRQENGYIMERFNRTLKGKLERLDVEYNESSVSGKSWEQFMGATLFAYNYGTTHRSLFELTNHKCSHRENIERYSTQTKR